jgi:hypothetical protein
VKLQANGVLKVALGHLVHASKAQVKESVMCVSIDLLEGVNLDPLHCVVFVEELNPLVVGQEST